MLIMVIQTKVDDTQHPTFTAAPPRTVDAASEDNAHIHQSVVARAVIALAHCCLSPDAPPRRRRVGASLSCADVVAAAVVYQRLPQGTRPTREHFCPLTQKRGARRTPEHAGLCVQQYTVSK